jgi:hypothetical protein
MPDAMPVVHCADVEWTSVFTDFAIETGAIPVNARFAVMGRAGVGLTTLGLRIFFADLIASFMALAPVRSANRAMALSERWNDRLKRATYRCLAYDAHQYMVDRKEKFQEALHKAQLVSIWPGPPCICLIAHTDQCGVILCPSSWLGW